MAAYIASGKRLHVNARARQLYDKQQGRCHYCDREMTLVLNQPLTVTADHVIPRANGGWDIDQNCVGACWQCNNLRGDFPYQEFKLTWRRFHANGLPLPYRDPTSQGHIDADAAGELLRRRQAAAARRLAAADRRAIPAAEAANQRRELPPSIIYQRGKPANR